MEVIKIPKKTVTLIEPQSSVDVFSKFNKKRVAAYCRVSTDSEEQLTSYETQKRVYTDMINSNNEWTLAGIYADEGISGTQAKKRTEKMIDDCLDGKIDYIITKSVSRFARNTVDCLEYVRTLKARGIGIIFEEQNIDTLKCDSELYLVIYAGFAQSESESMSKNITWTFRKKFAEGKVPFNYSKLVYRRKVTKGEEFNRHPNRKMTFIFVHMMFYKRSILLMITLFFETIYYSGMNRSAVFGLFICEQSAINISLRPIFQSKIIRNLSAQLYFELLNYTDEYISKNTVKLVKPINMLKRNPVTVSLFIIFLLQAETICAEAIIVDSF